MTQLYMFLRSVTKTAINYSLLKVWFQEQNLSTYPLEMAYCKYIPGVHVSLVGNHCICSPQFW